MRIMAYLLLAAAILGITACGGGSSGGGSSPGEDLASQPDPADGFWSGSTDNGYSFDLAIQGNGDVWLIYYDGFYVAGMVHGRAEGDANQITANGIRDYYFADGNTYTADVEGNLNSSRSITGTVTYPNEGTSTGFTGEYLPLYDETPSLETIAGTYLGASGNSNGAEGVLVIVDQNGSIDGASEYGCDFSGSLEPDQNGNLYDISITFDGVSCDYEGRTFDGIMVYEESTGFVYAGAAGSRASEGYVFLGERYEGN